MRSIEAQKYSDNKARSSSSEVTLTKTVACASIGRNSRIQLRRRGRRLAEPGLPPVSKASVEDQQKQCLGAVSLDLGKSRNLVEKTNREGFVENEAFTRLVAIVSGAFNILETERAIDKEAIRKTSRKSADIEYERIRDPIREIRRIASRKKVYAAWSRAYGSWKGTMIS